MKELLIEAINDSLKKLDIKDISVEIDVPKQKDFGDYSTNIAMKLTKVLGKNPLEIANLIVENINNDNITKMEVKAPGFINFFVKKDYLVENIKKPVQRS